MAWFFFPSSSCDDFCCLGINVKQTRAKNAIQFLIALTTSVAAASVDRGAQTEYRHLGAPQLGRDHRSRLQLRRDTLAFDFACWSNGRFAGAIAPDRKSNE
jgi:hypothetical protein